MAKPKGKAPAFGMRGTRKYASHGQEAYGAARKGRAMKKKGKKADLETDEADAASAERSVGRMVPMLPPPPLEPTGVEVHIAVVPSPPPPSNPVLFITR